MYTKLNMIEDTIRKKNCGGSNSGKGYDKDANELIDDLRKRNTALKKKVSAIIVHGNY